LKAELKQLILKSDEPDFVELVKSIEPDLKSVLSVQEILFEGEATLETEKFGVKVGILI